MKSPKILVVNDREPGYNITASYLKQNARKYSILTVVNGAEAYQVAAKEHPDLIIIDWEIPVMDGLDSVEKFKKTEMTQQIPVMVLSGIYKTPENTHPALETGSNDFISCSLDSTGFLAMVKSTLALTYHYQQEITRMQKAKKQLEENLRQKEQELVILAINNTYKRNLLVSLKKEIKKNLKKETYEGANNINALISTFEESEPEWEIFSDYFKLFHQGFFKRLIELHPGITQNEKRFCAYIRIGMSSREIAKLLNISLEGIKKARHRLRKKFSLSGFEALEDYINEI